MRLVLFHVVQILQNTARYILHERFLDDLLDSFCLDERVIHIGMFGIVVDGAGSPHIIADA